MLVIRAVTGLYPDTVLLDGNRGRGYESFLRVRHRKAVFVHRPNDGLPGSYSCNLARRMAAVLQSGPEVRFGDIANDLPERRFWIAGRNVQVVDDRADHIGSGSMSRCDGRSRRGTRN